MCTLFRKLYELGQLNYWIDVLDWLFDDKRFSIENNWNSKKSEKLTKSIRKNNNLSLSNNSIREINIYKELFPQQKKYDKPSLIIENKKTSISEKIIRHIRNGIAHGNYSFIESKDDVFIELFDYEHERKTNRLVQSAYIYMPLSFILDFFNLYASIQAKDLENT